MSEWKQHLLARCAVTVCRTISGEWTVSGDNDGRGGLFRDEESAFRFIRREFGPSATIVIKTSSAKSRHGSRIRRSTRSLRPKSKGRRQLKLQLRQRGAVQCQTSTR